MSIFSNIFSPKPTASSVVPPGTDTSSGGPNPNNPAEPTEPTGMDKFKDVWAPSTDQPNHNAPMFSVDPAKITEAAGTMNFIGNLKPEVLSAMAAGGEEGVKASMTAMNAMVQAVYAQNAMATTKIVEEAVRKTRDEFTSRLPSLVKNTQFNEALMQENPAFSHPAAQPIIKALQTQLSQKFPNATTTELKQMATDYLTNFADVVKPSQSNQSPAAAGEDWENFFESK